MTSALDELDQRARFGMRPGLDTIRGMLVLLGNPERGLRVVHVGGSNGKGSVCVMIASALEEAGHKTGLYTSPHLVRFHERIQVDGKEMSEAELERAWARLRPALDAFPEATYFECATALAFQHFADARVDVVVLEVGLGGRLDATNVIDAPLVTAVTNISLEHTEILGDTEAAIAREKGGIVKPRVPLVTGARGAALDVLREIAREKLAPLRVMGDDFVAIPSAPGAFETDGLREYGEVRIALEGAHQVENAAISLAALDVIDARGLAVPADAALRGLARARWPGRLQRIPGAPTILLDGAHNPAGMRALAAHLATLPKKPVVVFGALKDKDWRAMVETLAPVVSDAIVTRVPLAARALEPDEAARQFSMNGVFGIVVDEPGHALRSAEGIAGPDGLVLVTGSLYLVGDIISRLPSS